MMFNKHWPDVTMPSQIKATLWIYVLSNLQGHLSVSRFLILGLLLGLEHLLLEWLVIPQRSLLVLISDLRIEINSWPYILFPTVGICYQVDNIATITWQITFNETGLTCYCTSKLTICNQKFLTNDIFVTANNSMITFNARFRV